MTTAERIINRYIHMFYPANNCWLDCNLEWDPSCCRCVDEIELNIASLLFNKSLKDDVVYSFEFKDYMNNSLYHMKISDETCDVSIFEACHMCKDMKIIDSETRKHNLDGFIANEERRKIMQHDESVIVYSVLCLLKVNRDINLNRSDILKFYFLKDQNAFQQYLQDFQMYYIKSSSYVSDEFVLFHIKLIEFIIEHYALQKTSNILGDVFDVLEEDYFKNNYQCSHNVEAVRRSLNDVVLKYMNDELPMLKINVLSDTNTTIISLIAGIATTIKENGNWGLVKDLFVKINEYLLIILEKQKRLSETRISRDITRFNNIITH